MNRKGEKNPSGGAVMETARMAKLVKVGNVNDLQDGGKKKVSIKGQEIMLARAGGSYYAIANRCPHMGGDLSMGKLEGTVITCPRHGSQFDIRDGRVIRWTNWHGIVKTLSKAIKSPRPVKTYKVEVEKENISIEV